ncbi:piggyBac transposable element-derived protein 4-like [Dysidea avara]|uniref:piggyBac transposable element-derived protein 4-like n=1 Tax=Dysidea avara TaxID=196820 RepID=UPI0033224094
MGILRLPRLEMYWSGDCEFLVTPGLSSVMSRCTFEQIWRFLHLADNQLDDKTDKLFKVRPFLDLVTAQFSAQYTLHQPVTIDEVMIPYKGRLTFKQYMKNKPAKWGIKAVMPLMGLCSRVLLDLMTGLEGHHLFTDNYYTGPEVYLELYKWGNNCCGTVRTIRRGFPEELKNQNENDKRGVTMTTLAMDHCLRPLELPGTTVRRRNPDGTATNVPCPPLLPDYQQYMRGVDRGDQLIGCYNIGRRSKKWWKIIFSYIIECSLVNAYILERYAEPLLYRPSCTGRKKRDFLSFRLDIAEQLIGTHNLQQRSGRQPQHDSLTSPRLDPNRRHLPVQVESKARSAMYLLCAVFSSTSISDLFIAIS